MKRSAWEIRDVSKIESLQFCGRQFIDTEDSGGEGGGVRTENGWEQAEFSLTSWSCHELGHYKNNGTYLRRCRGSRFGWECQQSEQDHTQRKQFRSPVVDDSVYSVERIPVRSGLVGLLRSLGAGGPGMPLWGFEVGSRDRRGQASGQALDRQPLRPPTDPEDDGPGLTCSSRNAIGRSPI
jgi:hypothetical protein